MTFFEELRQRNVFRVAAGYVLLSWLILQVVDIVLPLIGAPEWVGRFMLLVLAIGFPIALFLSWAYEFTSEGVRRESDVVRDAATAKAVSRKIDFAIIGLLSLALLYLLASRYLDGTGRPGEMTQLSRDVTQTPLENAVAVLPFDNRSALESDVFFTDGMHDDLLTYLSRFESLKVISRTSVMRYKGTKKSIPEIARELGVAAIMEGGVQRSGDKVRINVQLIDAATDEHVWANIYDRTLTAENLFEIQTEIATSIARELEATLTPREQQRLQQAPTQSLDAYQEYLIGRQRMEGRTTAGLAESERRFRTALDYDSEFAPAWASLADSYQLQMYYSGYPRLEGALKARNAIDRALQLDPDLGEAYISLALMSRGDDAERAYRKGISLNPNYARGHQWYGWWLSRNGRLEQAESHLHQAVTLDPLSPIIQNSLGRVYQKKGDIDAAVDRFNRALEIDPGFAEAHAELAAYEYFVRGRCDSALAAIERYKELDPGKPKAYALPSFIFLHLGEPDLAAEWAQRSIELGAGSGEANYAMALLHLYRDEPRDAARYLDRLHEIDASFARAVNKLRDIELRNGSQRKARRRYLAAFPQLGEKAPQVDLRNYAAAVGFAHLLQQQGRTESAAVLLDAAMQVLSGVPRQARAWEGVGVLDAEIHALQGRTDEALAAIRQAIVAGWRDEWWYQEKYNPHFDELRQHPGFVQLFDVIRADLARQRERVRSMQDRGDITIGAVYDGLAP
ncbi:MAG: tetratricopeptide repeat protein [Gammaproteobacteria bacterium]|nr:tetratricopeptide repeat protein [Gammaproteobacteria bacterium]NNF62382.1 tetratricopeptide repeat protein [Gammaproteobacteria bacterium]NNM20928.1 tetratricopeptide repeat protein [Gammaproteobacteria bacterium]